jgi:Leucine-rich repeat (LRR) protein
MKVSKLIVTGLAVLLVLFSVRSISVATSPGVRVDPGPFDCATAAGVPESECEVLVALWNGTQGAGWYSQDGWLTARDPCTWRGVTCATGHVVRLFLPGNSLSGAIRPQLGDLASLQDLELGGNQLSGSIPPELGRLAYLEWLDLEANHLSGSIPPELGNLTSLQGLLLYGNDLCGSIPPAMRNLTNLRTFQL